ncbi:MAG: enoyl-CoA hydratase [Marinosulfonomonas sp.]|nr:enoyl-CoA hydratase [Marinosulfonomonas sp.]
MTDEITVHKENGLATVTLNRPDKLNALTLGMRLELVDAFRDIQFDRDVRAVLLRAEGRAFCAGADITTMGKDDILGDKMRLMRAHQMILAIHNVEKPVICAVRGPAVGIGLSIALACDVIHASEKAKFGLVFKKIGLAPDGGAAYFLNNLIGRQRTADLNFTARILDGKEAHDLGICAHVHADDALDAAAVDYAQDVAKGPTFAFGAAKRMLRAAQSPSLETFLDAEVAMQGQVIKSQDHGEGAQAFLEKRAPEFKGL